MTLSRLRILYCLNQCLHFLPLGLIFPVSTLFLLERGFSLGMIGTAFGLYSFVVFALELPTGGLADRIGRVKLYRISLFVKLINYLFYFFCFFYPQLILAMVLQGIARALNSGSLDAWYVDAHKGFSEEDTRKSLTLAAGMAPAALGAATLLGGFLPDLLSTPDFMEWTGKYGINILAGLLVIPGHYLFTRFFLAELPDFEKNRNTNRSEAFLPFMKKTLGVGISSPVLRRMLLITLFLGIGLSCIEGLWQPRFKSIAPDSPSFLLGLLSALYFFGATLGSLCSETLVKWLGEKKTLILAKVLHGLFFILLARQGGVFGFGICFTIHFMFHGALGGPHHHVLNRNIPENIRSSLLSLDSLFLMAGAAAGSVFSGWAAQFQGIPFVWTIGGGLIIFSSLLYLKIPKQEINKEERDAV